MQKIFAAFTTTLTLIFTLTGLLSYSFNTWAENSSPGARALSEGKLKEAEDYFIEKLNEPGLRNESLIALSRIYLEKGSTETAITYIEQALLLEPTTAEELLLLGDIYCNQAQKSSVFSALKLAKKCIAQYDAAVIAEPDNVDATISALRFNFEAPAIAGGSEKRGKELLEKLKTLSPESADTYTVIRLNANGKINDAVTLADELAKKNFQSERNQYEIAHFYRDKKQYTKAGVLFENLLSRPINDKNRWYVNDSLLQAGELVLIEGKDLKRSVELLEKYKQKNNNPNDIHYFWSSWSLAKAYKATGKQDKYQELVQKIKSENYKKDSAFTKEFEAAI